MSSRTTKEIRQIIRQAKQNTVAFGRLRSAIQRALPRLHRAVHLADHDKESVLTDFVLRYLDHVPNCLDALRGVARTTGIYEYAGVFLDTAADFFLKPSDTTDAQHGLLALMQRAYLAHRVFEELNDRVLVRWGIPLAPMDMTRANLLMHQLIGESGANDLDRLVHNVTSLHRDKEYLLGRSAVQHLITQQKATNWRHALMQWPCLAENLSIGLTFNRRHASTALISRAIH